MVFSGYRDKQSAILKKEAIFVAIRSLFPTGVRVVELPLDRITPNRAQPRKAFDEGSLRSLADSIEKNGLLCPISVRKAENGYELIAGERRMLAFRLLGRETIPAIVRRADDEDSAVLALVENLQRRDLTFFEEALALRALLDESGCPQKELALRLGTSQSALANKLRLLTLPREALQALADAGLGERHARALLPLAGDERLLPAVGRVIESHMTVARTEAFVEKLLAVREKRGGRILILKDLRLFTSTIHRAVDVMKEAGIDAVSTKTEDDDAITYTIVIPKKAARTLHLAPKAASSG